ncbi:MAG: hypothetical protein WC747_04465 [Candidatus Babeliales bacterium]|jgi:hypothetical protein
MKWRWLKITAGIVWGTNNLTRDDLARRKNGSYDSIIDLNEGTEFDPDQNAWIPVKGDES